MIAFELSMPRNNSWNGKWSGDAKRFIKVLSFPSANKGSAKVAEIIANGPYYYDFGDGWCAKVSVSQVNSPQGRSLRKLSAGFCGYDWMIESIRYYGEILRDDQIKERLAKASEPKVTTEEVERG